MDNTNNSSINKEKKPALGRPRKGKDRRLQIGVYIPSSVVDTIDEYVESKQPEMGRQYSRSDFINEAVNKHMRELGIIGGEEDA